MEFHRYPSFENSYRMEQFVKPFLEVYPILADIPYHITEKIHGTNFRIHCDVEGNIVLGKRNGILEPTKDHMGLRTVLSDLPWIEAAMKDFVAKFRVPMTLYGELFGHGIQGGIDYGEKKIRLFDMRVDGIMVPPVQFIRFINVYSLTDLTVPFLGIVEGLDKALEFNCIFKSKLADNKAEGIVIKPLNKVYYNCFDEIFYLKKKNPDFIERKPKKKKEKIEYPPNPLERYITKGRVEGVVLKDGGITSPKDFGRFIKLITLDAIEDYEKDESTVLTDRERKGVAKLIVKELKLML